MKKKEQIQRIVRMEEKHDRIRDVMDRLLPLLEEYGSLQVEISELAEYYQSEWRRDYEDDEKGKFPSELKRGILSEDTLYELLSDNDSLLEKMRDLISQSDK
ncbi:MAG: DUF4298 domain-containing protein [Erysipelotrichaceae bacterium]|nr:DUF4298 domain-containing protein [Erysipelotrichaceae bacterium]